MLQKKVCYFYLFAFVICLAQETDRSLIRNSLYVEARTSTADRILQASLLADKNLINIDQMAPDHKGDLHDPKQAQLLKQEDNILMQQRVYKRIHTPSEYHRAFSQELQMWAQDSQTVNATYLSNGRQFCQDNSPCDFFYYIIPQKCHNCGISQLQAQKSPQGPPKTLFLTSGMHGNEYLGPHVLLYSLKHILESDSHPRIIIFPLANPSGFFFNQRLTQPTKVDPNRDFPLEQQKKCYRASSTKIIDRIFRSFSIDLTIGIHNGGNEIGWNWGTKSQKGNGKSHTVDYSIYHDIGEMLAYLGGQNNKIKMKALNPGTMNQVIYDATNTFDDWAYAASWYYDPFEFQKRSGSSDSQAQPEHPKLMPIPQPTCDYSPYPKNMTNGLVFLLEVGPFRTAEQLFGNDEGVQFEPESKSVKNGYLSRVIRMLKRAVKVLQPTIQFRFTNTHVFMRLDGCKSGSLEQLLIKKVNSESGAQIIIFREDTAYNMSGTINAQQPQVLSISFSTPIIRANDFAHSSNLSDYKIQLEYTLKCDPEWRAHGQTVFAQSRDYRIGHTVDLITEQTVKTLDNLNQQNYFQSEEQVLQSFKFIRSTNDEDTWLNQSISGAMVGLVVVLFVVFIMIVCLLRVLCKQVIKNSRKNAIKDKIRQFEVGQIKFDTQNDEGKLEDSDNHINQSVSQPPKNSLDKYPELCESDKQIQSVMNEAVEQEFIQLSQFVKLSEMIYKD